jgi:hypothetical protein
VPKLLFVVRDRFVPIPSVQNMRRNRPFCAWVYPKLSAYATRAETKRICNPAALATKRANVARNMAIARHNVPNHDAKHAAAQIIKIASSFACPEHRCTKCKGMMDPKGHNKSPEAEVQARPLRKPKGKLHRDYNCIVQAIRC